jgi:hypothetical protein
VTAPAKSRRSGGTDRRRRARVEAARDREWLEWIGRFRFVTSSVLALRFGVSVRQANARVARFTHDGLVVVHREFVGQASAIYLSRAGCTFLGQQPRKAPRHDMQRAHELAIARLAARLELAEGPGEMRVLTERECRRREADGESGFSVRLPGPEDHLRWPDLVLYNAHVRDALELERAPKTTKRLRSIVEAYALSDYRRVLFLVESPALARRLAGLTRRISAEFAFQADAPQLVVMPHVELDDGQDAAVRAAIAA